MRQCCPGSPCSCPPRGGAAAAAWNSRHTRRSAQASGVSKNSSCALGHSASSVRPTLPARAMRAMGSRSRARGLGRRHNVSSPASGSRWAEPLVAAELRAVLRAPARGKAPQAGASRVVVDLLVRVVWVLGACEGRQAHAEELSVEHPWVQACRASSSARTLGAGTRRRRQAA